MEKSDVTDSPHILREDVSLSSGQEGKGTDTNSGKGAVIAAISL